MLRSAATGKDGIRTTTSRRRYSTGSYVSAGEGFVGGRILFSDSTHVKAKANKHKKFSVEAEQTPKAYTKELDEAIAKEREELGNKPFDPKDGPPPVKTVQQSKTDPDS